MRLLEFEELRQGNMMVEMVKYVIKFGGMHLINHTVRYSFNKKNDVDIKCLIGLLLSPLIYLVHCYLSWMFYSVFCCYCSKRK